MVSQKDLGKIFLPSPFQGHQNIPLTSRHPLHPLMMQCHLLKRMSDTGEHNNTTDDELEDIDLYYKVLSRYKPEPGESNAESAFRHQSIDDEYQQLRREKRCQRLQKQATQNSHDLTPSTPRESSLQFRHDPFSSSSIHRTHEVSPIIEPAIPSPEPEHNNTITNNVQEVSIYTDYTLYPRMAPNP
jgi:hypothetical protein